jgi:hypothetical protein
MFDSGYLTIGRVRGAPIRVHWSAPLGAIAFTGFSLRPELWIGFLVLVVLHELGHALLVRRLGYQVIAVRVHAFGGDCQWAGDPTRVEDAVVAWGGVLAQALVWVVATVTIAVLGWPTSTLLWALAVTFTSTNAHMILFNLLPIPPLDGHRAWPLIPMLWEARKEQKEHQRARAEQRRRKDREVAEANARQATKEEIAAMDAAEKTEKENGEPPPMPPELKAALDRILGDIQKTPRGGNKPDPDLN